MEIVLKIVTPIVLIVTSIISYFLKSLMNEHKEYKKKVDLMDTKLQILENEHINKVEMLNDKIDSLYNAIEKLSDKLDKINEHVK